MLAAAATVVAPEEVVPAPENASKRKKKAKKEERKEKETEKNSSVTLELDTMVADEVSNKGKWRDTLLRSIAAFLESNGLSRTLSTLQSESGIEFRHKKTSAVNLEDLLSEFLESSNDPVENATIGWLQNQGNPNASMEIVGKNINNVAEQYAEKKRKKTDESDKNKLDEGCPQSVNLGEITDNKSDDFQVKDTIELRENGTLKKLKPSLNLDADTKGKKRKNKSGSDPLSLPENSNSKQLESTVGVRNIIDLELANPCESKKEKKKKKHKNSSDVDTEIVQINDNGKLNKTIGHMDELRSLTNGSSERMDKIEKKKERKVKDAHSEVPCSTTEKKTNDKLAEAENSTLPTVENLSNDKNSKRKEKEKKHNSTPESLMEPGKSFDGTDAKKKSDTQQDVQGSDLANSSAPATVDIDSKVGKKSSKNRKRATSEEEKDNIQRNNSGTVNVKTDETNADAEQNVLTKKLKKEEGKGNDKFPILSNAEKEVGELIANGTVANNNGEAGSLSKETKKDKKSKEPKSVTPFQRVKVDEVKFSDQRLQDNSYWAKGGADSGYGAKAQEVLGQVRGRDFRHEKTKKKRGTYRGGVIDLQSHSIKFTYSDDE